MKFLRLQALAFIFIFTMSGSLSSQIRGYVLDMETKEPLSGANVYLKVSRIGTTTNLNGYFILSATFNKVKNDTLVISYLGYEDSFIAISDYNDNSTTYLNPGSLTLDQTINIYAERLDLARQEIPHMKEAVSAAELERYGTSEISDLFKRMPSVRVEGNDLDGRHVQIRGSNSSEVNVYLDGVLINSLSFSNAADLTVIPTEYIYKLEVLKGSNLPLLGKGAFGGVLNILSKKDVNSSVMLKTKVGDYDTRYYIGYINLPLMHNIFINYFGQYNEMKPEIEYFPGERFSEKSTNDFIKSRKHNHNLSIDYFTDFGQFRTKLFLYRFEYDKPEWYNERNNYLLAFTFNGKNDFNTVISYLNSKDKINRYILETNQNISEYESQNINIKLSKKYIYKISSIQLVGEYFHDELESFASLKKPAGTFTYNKTSLYDNRAGFAGIFSFEDQYDSLGTLQWKTFLGLRGDISAGGHKDLTNTLGLELRWRRYNWEFKPYFNYGRNAKYPTLLESAYVGDLITYNSTDTTSHQLEPEYNTSFELGSLARYSLARAFLSHIDFSLAYFYNSMYNKILRRPFGDYITQSQIGRNTTQGAEASIKAKEIFKRFDVTASFTGLDISNPLLYEFKPETSFNFQVDYFSQFGLYLTAVYFNEGKSYAWYFDAANELRTQEIEPNWDVDVSLGYKFNISRLNLNMQVSGYNLFDNSEFKFYYLKKRYIQASLSIQY